MATLLVNPNDINWDYNPVGQVVSLREKTEQQGQFGPIVQDAVIKAFRQTRCMENTRHLSRYDSQYYILCEDDTVRILHVIEIVRYANVTGQVISRQHGCIVLDDVYSKDDFDFSI